MTIGETLAAAREAAGVDVAQLSERTRIRPHIIAAIERDDFAVCAGDFYARGHIRTLARELGLDPAGLVERFDADHGRAQGPSVDEIFPTFRPAPVGERPRVRWRLLMAVAAAGAIGLGAVQVYAEPAEPEADSPLRAATTQLSEPGRSDRQEEPAQESDGGEGDAGSEEESEEDAEAKDEVTLVIEARQRTWLSVTDDAGSELFTGILARGDERDFHDESRLQLSLGNAGGVDLVVNDEEQPSPGDAGEVAHLTVQPDGVSEGG